MKRGLANLGILHNSDQCFQIIQEKVQEIANKIKHILITKNQTNKYILCNRKITLC